MRDDRRKSRRFPVLGDEQQQATLRVGDVLIPVRLLDQSATGFAIRVEEHPGVFPGELVWLQTVAGWTEARVVKARHDVDGTHIGLERIADLASKPETSKRLLPEQLAQQNPKHNPWPILILVLGLTSLLAFLAWTAFDRHLTNGLRSFLPMSQSEPVDPRPSAVRAVEHEATRRAAELQKSIRQSGATMLLLPEIVAHLKLTVDQQRRLQQIVQAVARQEQELQQSGTASRETAEKIDEFRSQASQQALEVLSDSQRQQWQSMFKDVLDRLTNQAAEKERKP